MKVPARGFSPFVDLLGLTFNECDDGRSVCSVQVRPELLNSQGILHGGVAYAVADSGMGFALHSCIGDDEKVATLEVQIVYFKAVKSGTLTCNARVVHRSKRLGTVEAELTDGRHQIARALGTFSISRRRGAPTVPAAGEHSPGANTRS